MKLEKLFLGTVNELFQRIISTDDYDILRSTALIRQLLLDGGKSLVDKVNRNYKIPLQFGVSTYSLNHVELSLKPDLYIINPLDPKRHLKHNSTTAITRAQFLMIKVAEINGISFTIKEIILYAAYVEGGVHFGKPKPQEKDLEYLTRIQIFSHHDQLLSLIKSIGWIVLEALRDLLIRL